MTIATIFKLVRPEQAPAGSTASIMAYAEGMQAPVAHMTMDWPEEVDLTFGQAPALYALGEIQADGQFNLQHRVADQGW